jgi:hypothetical protein
MHGSVRVELENLLAAEPSAAATEIAGMLKTLKAPAEMEPSAGFYARVMQRIEASARRSIWWVFVYSPIGKRVAYVSLALSLALGTYMVAAESTDDDAVHALVQKAHGNRNHFDALVTGSADEQRAAVLANFVAHPVSEQTLIAQ